MNTSWCIYFTLLIHNIYLAWFDEHTKFPSWEGRNKLTDRFPNIIKQRKTEIFNLDTVSILFSLFAFRAHKGKHGLAWDWQNIQSRRWIFGLTQCVCSGMAKYIPIHRLYRVQMFRVHPDRQPLSMSHLQIEQLKTTHLWLWAWCWIELILHTEIRTSGGNDVAHFCWNMNNYNAKFT